MLAIYKRELKTYFTSLFTYVYYGMFFLITGIFFATYCLTSYSTQFGYYVLSRSYYVIVAVIPLCTMRLLSQERRNKTDQLLFTAPVSAFSILLGKYLATLTYVLLPVVISVLYPVFISMHGKMSVPFVFASYLGVVLVTLVLLSMGMFISSLTTNATLAAVISYAVYVLILLARFVESLAGNHDALYNFLHEISIYNKFNDMFSGIVRSGDILFLLLLTICFFVLALLVLESRRQSGKRIAAYMAATVLAGTVLGAVFLLNTRVFDFTAEKLLTLSEETRQEVSSIQKPTQIYYMGLKSRANATYHELLAAYADLNENITVEYIDVQNNSGFRQQYLPDASAISESSILVACGDKTIYLNADDYITLTQTSAYSEERSLEIEEQLTRAIVYTNTETADKLCVLSGHGEEGLNSGFENLLLLNNYELEEVNLPSAITSMQDAIPASCKAVLLNAPQSDFSKDEIEVLEQYLQDGGKLFVTLDPLNEQLENLYAFLKEYGLEVVSGVVVEREEGFYVDNTPFYLMPEIEENQYTQEFLKDNLHVLTMTSKGIRKNGQAGGYVSTDILTTSGTAFSKVSNFEDDQLTVKSEEDIAGPFSVASCAISPDKGTLFLLASNIFFNEDADRESNGANRRFFIEMLSQLTGTTPGIWIEGKNVGSQIALYPNNSLGVLKIMTIIVLPLIILLFGIVILFLRKKGILMFGLLVCAGVFSCHQAVKADWIETPEGTQYEQTEGQYAVGFTQIQGKRYYFNADGYLKKGKFKVKEDGNTAYYYADKQGVIQTGLIETKKYIYQTDETGKILTGFVDIAGQRYYFNENAEPVTGWFQWEGNWYYGEDKGRLATGFLELNGYRYYMNPDGSKVSNTVMLIDGITYVFNEDGSVDENSTLMYPVLEYINNVRAASGKSPVELNTRLQACAMLRAADLPQGYGVSSQTMESLLSTRGVKCTSGYELSYGGVPDYSIQRLIEDMKKDANLHQVLQGNVSQLGLGIYEQNGISYYDFVLICTDNH